MKPNGCNNRKPPASNIRVQSGWTEDGRRLMKWIADPMTKACQYQHTDLGKADQGCTGCVWRTA